MTMHLEQGLSTINSRRPKHKKMTKRDYERLVEQHRAHNRRAKQTNNRHMMMSFQQYLDYCRPKHTVSQVVTSKKRDFVPEQPTIRQSAQSAAEIKSHGITADNCSKKESTKYTGDYVTGICTMHKSNAVPVTNGEHAKDIARMRRG